MSEELRKCQSCTKWTNYGLTCVRCSPKPLDKLTVLKKDEPDPYYDEYRPGSEYIDEEYLDEDED